MKTTNVIDLTSYFTRNAAMTQEERNRENAQKVVQGLRKAFEVAATAAITLCVCACTLLFFTML